MPADHPMPLNLHKTAYGEASNIPLVILHGLYGSSTNWRSIAKLLSDQYFVIAVDLRNHGMSPWEDSMQYVEMAADVGSLLDKLGLKKPIVLGHSMGGKTAMALAQMELADLGSLIVADIAPVPYQHTLIEFAESMANVDLEQAGSRGDVDSQLAAMIPDAMIRQFLLQNLARTDKGFRWRINLDAICENMSFLTGYDIDQTSEIDTLFIAGGNSNYITTEAHSTINRLFPSSTIETIDHAGHWLHAEQPKIFCRIVREFIETRRYISTPS